MYIYKIKRNYISLLLPKTHELNHRVYNMMLFITCFPLQVSHKGLKIIQNVTAKGKQQTIKHFIPHGSITSAVAQGDVVACVLLLFNPITGCPVHVHAYRLVIIEPYFLHYYLYK